MLSDNPLRAADVRINNEKIILSRIYENQKTGISQSELVRETGLKAPTLLRIFSKLEELGLIETIDPADCRTSKNGKGGRYPVLYTIRGDALYTIGLEFWGASLSLGVFNFSGRLVFSRTESLRLNIDTRELIDCILRIINETLENLKIPREKVPGIGVAAPGQIDVTNRRVVFYSRIKGMRDFPLAGELEKRLGIKILIHNNCSAIAFSEYRYGAYKHRESMFVFLLRIGVNGAFVNKQGIYITNQGTTLECGHLPIDPKGGPLCSCGKRGCLQAFLADLDSANVEAGLPLFYNLEAPLRAGDSEAVRRINLAADYLMISMKSIMLLLAPESFLVIGAGLQVSQMLAERIREKLLRESDVYAPYPPSIFSHTYDPLVAQRGASDLVLADYFS
ncbi:MAG: ROK family protein [Treponema sp.]|jgi:predicted NBD/HSP70 family sugar kinase|nr:ROK family protein [Treponema sp.]